MDLANYQTVKTRKLLFKKDYPSGRILPELVTNEGQHTVFRVLIYATPEDQANNLPLSTGHAEEFQGQGGFANKHAWFENCEESAIGRALDNAGYHGNGASLEEMKKVEHHKHEDSKIGKAEAAIMACVEMEEAERIDLKLRSEFTGKDQKRLLILLDLQIGQIEKAEIRRIHA